VGASRALPAESAAADVTNGVHQFAGADALIGLIGLSPLPVVVHDDVGNVVHANAAFATLLGYTLPQVLMLHVGDVIHPADRAERDELAKRLNAESVDHAEADRRLLHRNGDTVMVHSYKSAITVAGRRLIMVCIQDMGSWHRRVQQLTDAAFRDELTGLLNRAGIQHYIDQLPDGTHDGRLAMLDVNGLKSVNDTLGHAAGDEVLLVVARRLTAADREWTIGRWGGDEFLVIECNRSEPLQPRIERALSAGEVGELRPSVSIGETLFTLTRPFAELIDIADNLMYQHKRSRT
jgi:diguanylate cyclase (GGDEF)-like protein/PAS domain S-box-containing protein